MDLGVKNERVKSKGGSYNLKSVCKCTKQNKIWIFCSKPFGCFVF